MSHIKVTGPDAWDFGEQQAVFVKVSSRGLIGYDRSVLVKRAGAEFAELARNIEFKPDEVPLHLIALGATEAYANNRNGDGFKEASLKKWHPTFVKLAKLYQHHKNKDPLKSYGVVKLSYYDPEMRRVMLLAALNKTAEAARRNAGLVDEQFVNDAESGKDLAFSMACRIAHDECAICGNKAPTRDDYCESEKQGGTCPGFGCRNGLTRVLDDGRIQHVDNPEPRFFDISKVRRPADRTAYGGLADYLMKAASQNHGVGGTELAELMGVETPDWLLTDNMTILELQKLAQDLARIEEEVERRIVLQDSLAPISANTFNTKTLGSPENGGSLSKLAALSQQRIVLSPAEFVTWIFGQENAEKTAGMKRYLPGIYGRLIKSSEFNAWLVDNPYRHAGHIPSPADSRWADALTDLALNSKAVTKRALHAFTEATRANPQVLTKTAQDNSPDCQLAELYAAYKLAFIEAQNSELPLTAWFAIRQNYD